MSYTVKLLQQRNSTNIDFFSVSDDVINKLEEYKSSGKIISYDFSDISEDKLTKTMVITFNSLDDHALAVNEDVFYDSAISRIAYCNAHSISWSVEHVD